MIVSELIAKLQTLPQDALVLGRGYESGMDTVDTVDTQMCHFIPNQPSYEGDYDINWLEKPGIVDDIQAVYIR